jgi:bacteriocin biosynthesis cyclodehydratase domain-containing protein
VTDGPQVAALGAPGDLPAKPLLPGFYRVIPMGPDAMQVRSAGRVLRVAGPGMGGYGPPLLSALDGRSTLAELAARFPLAQQDLERLVLRLHELGVLGDGPAPNGTVGGNAATSEFFAAQGAGGGDVQPALSGARVLFSGLGPVARIAARHLAVAGVGTLVLADPGAVTAMDQAILPAGGQGGGWARSRAAADECLTAARDARAGAGLPTVVIEGDAPIEEIIERSGALSLAAAEVDEPGWRAEAANAACLSAEVPATFHEVSTIEGIVGPTVTPASPCYECLMSRRLSHMRYFDEYVGYRQALRSREIPIRQPALLGGCAAIVGGLLSAEILGRLLGRRVGPADGGTILVADFRTMEVRRETVLAVPGCPACGSGQEHVVLGS